MTAEFSRGKYIKTSPRPTFSPHTSPSYTIYLIPSSNLLFHYGQFQFFLTEVTDELTNYSQTSETCPTSFCCGLRRIWTAVHYLPSQGHAKSSISDCSPASGNTTSDFRTAICCIWLSNTTTLTLQRLCSSTTPTSMHFTGAKLH